MLVLAIAALALDQVTKALVINSIARGEREEVLPFLDLVHVENEGVAFGFLDGAPGGIVMAVTLIALAFVVVWFALSSSKSFAWVAVGLLLGGAVGNLADRLLRDGVVDFIDFPGWPSFNVADVTITLGALGLVLVALRAPADDEVRE